MTSVALLSLRRIFLELLHTVRHQYTLAYLEAASLQIVRIISSHPVQQRDKAVLPWF